MPVHAGKPTQEGLEKQRETTYRNKKIILYRVRGGNWYNYGYWIAYSVDYNIHSLARTEQSAWQQICRSIEKKIFKKTSEGY